MDIATVEQVREATAEAMGLIEVLHLVVDCRRLDFLDSSGLKIILEAHRDFEGRIALMGAKRAVTRILEVTGVDDMFRRVETLEAARTVLHQDRQPEASVGD